MEFEKYRLIREFERANRPLSVAEKAELTKYSVGYLAFGLRAMVKQEWERRNAHDVYNNSPCPSDG